MSKETLTIISGKDLISLLEVNPQDYTPLYPNRGFPNYCPCMDVGIGGCHGMFTVMDFLGIKEIRGFPKGTKKVKNGKYKSGEVWIDTSYGVAYLYVGQLPKNKDVVINLGGDTRGMGDVEICNINKSMKAEFSLIKKFFQKNKSLTYLTCSFIINI